MYIAPLNHAVRYYLRNCPITDGKRALLAWSKRFIAPTEQWVISRTRQDFQLRLNLRNPEHERIYYFGEHDERNEARALSRLIAPSDQCWDIGANIGFYTCYLARLAWRGRVAAFEPAPETRKLLQTNLALNGLKNVDVRDQAVTDREGPARVYFQRGELAEGTASLLEGEMLQSAAITTTTLDHVIQELPAPQFVKIDVEGCQQAVWLGGRAFFESHHPLVLAELRDLPNGRDQDYDDTQQLVERYGYRIYAAGKHRFEAIERLSKETYRKNYFLVHQTDQRINTVSTLDY